MTLKPLPDDSAAWMSSVLDRFEAPLVGYATRLLGDVEAARDVAQDTFLRLLRAPRETVEPILARWLFTVCRHRVVDLQRKGKHMTRLAPEALDATLRDGAPSSNGKASSHGEAGPVAEMRDEASRALRAIEALPAAQQEVLRLKFEYGLSYADIANVTGLSTSHVGVRIHEGMRTLRARLVRPSLPAGRVGGVR